MSAASLLSSAAGAALAQQQDVLLQVHGALLAVMFAAVFYVRVSQGVAVSLAANYFRRASSQKDESIFVWTYVWTTMAGGTACLAIQASALYRDLTTLSTHGAASTSRVTVMQTLEAWFGVEVNAYYVYRAVRVTNYRILQTLAVLLGLGTVAGFLGCAIVTVRVHLHDALPHKEAAWAFAADGLLSALILFYELVYKRRAAVFKSSLVQQFTIVALRSSVALLPLLFSMAVMVTVGFVTQKRVYPGLLERPSLSRRSNNTTLSVTLGTRANAAKPSAQRRSLEQRPSHHLYHVAIVSREHPAHRDADGAQGVLIEQDAPYGDELEASEAPQAPPSTAPGPSTQVSWVARIKVRQGKRESQESESEASDGEQISLRAFLRHSLV
ncbi:hypothetical protein Rt10032_c02g1088 [Rhodotorula toruloides]|uniref:Uncharacterized protein n=1 Tax=Rhodotorula toruloides TaxID=5286 RepID=A0A511K9P8_RHOTO|nr:hypothetical protein Rt10032_c02g1088 [Rhodotorula toruloides]